MSFRVQTVSYTHLDVYKRQRQIRRNCMKDLNKPLKILLCSIQMGYNKKMCIRDSYKRLQQPKNEDGVEIEKSLSLIHI